MTTIREKIRAAVNKALGHADAVEQQASAPRTQMAIALNRTGKPVYAGTVAKATVTRRRAANKRARQARAMHRRAAR